MSTTTYAASVENGLGNGSIRFEPKLSSNNTSKSKTTASITTTKHTQNKTNGNHVGSKPSGDKLEEAFLAAVEAIKSLPKNGPFQPSNEMLLKFYAYYKQATFGPVKSSRPSMFKVVERAKYDAWNSVRALSREEAMQGYIDEIKNIIETMPQSQHVEKFMNAIGPFYEYVGDEEDNEDENNNNNNNENGDDEEDELARNNTSNDVSGEKLIIDSSKHEIDEDDEVQSSASMKRVNGVANKKSLESNGYHAPNNNSNGNTNGLNGAQKKLNGDEPSSINGLNGSSFSTNERDPSGITASAKPEAQSYSNGNGCWTSTSIMNGSAFVPIYHSPPSSIQHQQQQQQRERQEDGELMGLSVMGMGGLMDNNEMMLLLERTSKRTPPDDESDRFSALVRKCGGEIGSPSATTSGFGSGSSQQLASRQSRPGSSLSQSNMPSGNNPSDRRLYGGAGGSGGGNPPTSTNEYLMAQETNRQILLILMRLREDTNNVLTRLSFLESSVVSLQTNLQMNGANGTTSAAASSSAFALVNSQRSPPSSRTVARNGSIFYSLFEFIKTIDWKTVTIAVIWPIIIRLVFYFFKKVRLVIKFKRIRN